ncbi:MAG TPA: molybdopterin-dependent oxidoreductase [Rubricoccaceae bacterium]|jgi:DMSO/TMAO reductase YedYZ molybdopterin-dependent catalytic subunit
MKETPDQRAARLRAEALAGPTLSEAEFQTRSRRAFLVAGASALVGAAGWQWLTTGPTDDRIPALLRDGHRLNERLWRSLYSPGRLAPTFAASASEMPRVNGRYGLRGPFAPDAWTMRVLGPDGRLLDTLDLDDVRALPRVEMTTEMKCIEGWSTVVTWGGARFSDFAARYASRLPRGLPYVGLATPDGAYTVGMDAAAMAHPQTLLAYEMQGAPLTPEHGAPLRLATPLKYGVKSLKRIGTVRFMEGRPQDFWAERGYDWYIGH